MNKISSGIKLIIGWILLILLITLPYILGFIFAKITNN